MSENIINEANRWHEFKKLLQNSGLRFSLPYDEDGNYDLKKLVELIAFAIYTKNKENNNEF